MTSRGLYRVLVNLSSLAGGNIANVPSHMWSWEIVQFAASCWFFPWSRGISSYSCADEYSTATPRVPCAVLCSALCCFLLSDILPHKFLLPLLHLTLIIFFSIHHVTGLCLNSPFLCHSLESPSRALNWGSRSPHLLLSLLSRITVQCLKNSSSIYFVLFSSFWRKEISTLCYSIKTTTRSSIILDS